MYSNSNQFYNSSSSSSSETICDYDVFISFSGPDLRHNFVSHLLRSFKSEGINTFKDEEFLTKGQSIGPALMQAIEGSQVLIVVFSEKYASSVWCLRELVKIMDCHAAGKNVLPIYYGVDPSHVRRQSGPYAEAFARHAQRFDNEEKMAEMKRWRESLRQATDIRGWIATDKSHDEVIKGITKLVLSLKDLADPKPFRRLVDELIGS